MMLEESLLILCGALAAVNVILAYALVVVTQRRPYAGRLSSADHVEDGLIGKPPQYAQALPRQNPTSTSGSCANQSTESKTCFVF